MTEFIQMTDRLKKAVGNKLGKLEGDRGGGGHVCEIDRQRQTDKKNGDKQRKREENGERKGDKNLFQLMNS